MGSGLLVQALEPEKVGHVTANPAKVTSLISKLCSLMHCDQRHR